MSGVPGPVQPAPGGEGVPRAFGTFTLLRKIAAGSRGEVFAAWRPVEVERLCAIKLLPAALTRRPEFLSAMRDEAPRLVRRVHGNLVPIYDVGTVDQQLFIVSELVEGMDVATLGRRLRERGLGFPVDLAVFVAMEVAAAVGALRRAELRQGATPAAVMPALPAHSIFVTSDGQVKLLHYGATLTAVGVRDSGDSPQLASDARLVGRLLVGLVGSALSSVPVLARVIERAVSDDPAQRLTDADQLRTELGGVLRTLRGAKVAGAETAAGELVRGALAPGGATDRAALTAIARAFDRSPPPSAAEAPRRGVTLARVDARGGGRPPAPVVVGPDLTIGEVIPGTRYRVLSTIGEGGMGTVYAAEHVDLEKKVALKLLRADVAANAETMQWFRQEARAASKIGSEYICDVTDFGELGDGRVFFVMPFLDGQSLGRVLRQSARVPPARAIGILRQVAKALGAAHDKSIVHLDVKPDNVMLLARGKRDDAVKVVDFGIAGLVQAQAAEAQQTIAGTPEYIAPERAAGRAYDRRADVYSLGAMAYEMLCGCVPIQGKDPLTTLTMHLKDPPRPFAEHAVAKDVPEALSSLVLRMLEKDPSARPASMAEVEALLCEAQIAGSLTTPWDDLDLPAVDEEWREKLARRMPTARRPRRAMLGAAAMVAVVSLGVAGYLGFVRAPQVVVKEVRVELTKTEEAPEVAAALLKAAEAARRERYVRPVEDSALHHIELAETQAERLKRKSPGAAMLRRVYASALAVISNELLKADLTELGVAKFKEALMFAPDDVELQQKAGLTPEERKPPPVRERRPAGGTPAVAAVAPAPGDEAKDAASRVFLAATRGRLSEARLNLAALNRLDLGGTQTARLADALRVRAGAAWGADKKEEARALYTLVYELDSSDVQARERSRETVVAPVAPPPPAEVAPAAPPPPPVAPSRPRRRQEAPAATADADPDSPRDPAAAQAAAELGKVALARGRLGEAETAFTRAVRADAQNAAGVAGLGEVAFERARYSDALDFARRAARLSPRNAKAYVLAGDAYFKLLRYDDALRSYEKARGIAPQDDEVRSRLERLRAKVGAH